MNHKKKDRLLSNEEIAAFSKQMAMILSSGISSLEGVSLMKDDAALSADADILENLYTSLSLTGNFADAVEETGVFPPYFLQMCRIGEQSGQLDKVMGSLAAFYDREAGIAASIKNAVTYPVIMLAMMLVVVAVLLARVLPVFQQVFAQLGTEMNWASRQLVTFGNFLNRYGFIFIVILLVLAALVLYFTHTEGGRRKFTAISGKLPFTRKYADLTASCRFAGGMSLLMPGGFSPEESVTMAGELSGSPRFQEKVQVCLQEMQNGEELSSALIKSGIFTGVYGRMVLVAQKTGTIDEVMQDIALRYEDELDTRLADTMSVLEPTLVAILSVITGGILLSVMLPLLGILSGM